MATLMGISPAHRHHAEAIPEGLRSQLSGAELAARCTEMAALDRHAAVSGVEPEIALHLARRKKLVANAIPLVEYIERRKEIGHKIDGAGDHDVRNSYWSLHRKLGEDNRYPDGLESEVDAALLGKESTPEAEAIVRHHRGR